MMDDLIKSFKLMKHFGRVDGKGVIPSGEENDWRVSV